MFRKESLATKSWWRWIAPKLSLASHLKQHAVSKPPICQHFAPSVVYRNWKRPCFTPISVQRIFFSSRQSSHTTVHPHIGSMSKSVQQGFKAHELVTSRCTLFGLKARESRGQSQYLLDYESCRVPENTISLSLTLSF